MGHGRVWAPLLRNSGGVDGACVVVVLPLLSLLLAAPFGLSFSPARRQRSTQAGPRPASLQACVSKPFEFEARSTASNSLLSSPPAQPEVISLPPMFIPFYCPSSSHQRKTVSLLPTYLLCSPDSSLHFWAPLLCLIHDSIVNQPCPPPIPALLLPLGTRRTLSKVLSLSKLSSALPFPPTPFLF